MESFHTRDAVQDGESIELDQPTRISGAVGQGARVCAKKELVIDGNVGAATIEAAGDLTIHGGVVGKGLAILRVAENLRVSFLDSAELEIGKGLILSAQALNCQMLIHGWIDAPEGSIVGGEARVMRSVKVRSLGSDSAVPTTIVLGAAPLLDERLNALQLLAKANDDQLARAQREMDRLSSPGLILKPADKERQTELTFEIQRMQALHHRCEASLGLGLEELKRARATDLTVLDHLHPGVVIEADASAIAVDRAVIGPLRIFRDPKGNLLIKTGSHGDGVPIKNMQDFRILSARTARAKARP